MRPKFETVKIVTGEAAANKELKDGLTYLNAVSSGKHVSFIFGVPEKPGPAVMHPKFDTVKIVTGEAAANKELKDGLIYLDAFSSGKHVSFIFGVPEKPGPAITDTLGLPGDKESGTKT